MRRVTPHHERQTTDQQRRGAGEPTLSQGPKQYLQRENQRTFGTTARAGHAARTASRETQDDLENLA